MINKDFFTSLDKKGLLYGAGAGSVLFLLCLILAINSGPKAPEYTVLGIPDILLAETLSTEEHEAEQDLLAQSEEETALAPTQPLKTLHFVIQNIPDNSAAIEAIQNSLPTGVSLALSPYQNQLKTRINQLRDRGHDVWVTLPSQTIASASMREDAGPLAITLNRQDAENIRIATHLAAQTHRASGLLLPADSVFPARENAWKPVSNALAELDVTILDSSTQTVGGEFLLSDHYLKTDLVLDYLPRRHAIEAEIAKIPSVFETKDHAIVTLSPYPISLKILSEFLQTLSPQEWSIRPISERVSLRPKAFQSVNDPDKHNSAETEQSASDTPPESEH